MIISGILLARVYILPLSCRSGNILKICIHAPWPSRPFYGHAMTTIDGACTKYSSRLKECNCATKLIFGGRLPWSPTFNLQPSSCPGPPTAVPRTSTNNNQTSTNSNFKRQNTVDSATIKENTARLSQSAATPTRPSTAKTPSFSSGDGE